MKKSDPDHAIIEAGVIEGHYQLLENKWKEICNKREFNSCSRKPTDIVPKFKEMTTYLRVNYRNWRAVPKLFMKSHSRMPIKFLVNRPEHLQLWERKRKPIQNQLINGIIRVSKSPCNIGLSVVPKNGKSRVCLDFWPLNLETVKICISPGIDEYWTAQWIMYICDFRFYFVAFPPTNG